MIAMFFMSIPLSNTKAESQQDNSNDSNHDEQLMSLVKEHVECEEIKLLLENNAVTKIIATEKIKNTNSINIERLCNEYSHQDITIKIRHHNKVVIERTRIINL